MNNYIFARDAMKAFATTSDENIGIGIVLKITNRLNAADKLAEAFEAIESGHAPDSQRKEALREYYQKIADI